MKKKSKKKTNLAKMLEDAQFQGIRKRCKAIFTLDGYTVKCDYNPKTGQLRNAVLS